MRDFLVALATAAAAVALGYLLAQWALDHWYCDTCSPPFLSAAFRAAVLG